MSPGVTEPLAVELLWYVFIFCHITATSSLPLWLPSSGRAFGFDMMTLSKKQLSLAEFTMLTYLKHLIVVLFSLFFTSISSGSWLTFGKVVAVHVIHHAFRERLV
jgi:hypothetical protein